MHLNLDGDYNRVINVWDDRVRLDLKKTWTGAVTAANTYSYRSLSVYISASTPPTSYHIPAIVIRERS